MISRSRPVVLGTALAAVLTALGAARADPLERDDLAGPPLEAIKDPPKVALPTLPAFDLPAVAPGLHSPRELRLRGRALRGTEVKVAGYVTGIYDCAAALAIVNPKATRAQIAASIRKNPALCEPPKLYLGDAKGAARDDSIAVVEPGKAKLAVGDFVVVTGTWDVQVPHDDHAADGRLALRAVERARPPTAAPAAPPASEPPDVAVVTQAPLRPVVAAAARTRSMQHLAACNQAFAARQYDAAITACKAATQAWPGNHLAWYVGASAHMAKNEWPEAEAETEAAVTRRPDQAMYQLYAGVARYEAARAQNDPAQPKLEAARDALLRAAKLAPSLWRAHFYLGRVYRDLDDARHAAEQFAQTIETHPAYRFGYLALGELCRRWGYHDAAIAIAELGVQHVPADEAGELVFDAASARLARGQRALHQGDVASAKRDLDDVMAQTEPRVAALRPLAAQLLDQIAHKR